MLLKLVKASPLKWQWVSSVARQAACSWSETAEVLNLKLWLALPAVRWRVIQPVWNSHCGFDVKYSTLDVKQHIDSQNLTSFVARYTCRPANSQALCWASWPWLLPFLPPPLQTHVKKEVQDINTVCFMLKSGLWDLGQVPGLAEQWAQNKILMLSIIALKRVVIVPGCPSKLTV